MYNVSLLQLVPTKVWHNYDLPVTRHISRRRVLIQSAVSLGYRLRSRANFAWYVYASCVFVIFSILKQSDKYR